MDASTASPQSQSISPLRQRMLEDMRMRKLCDKTQIQYIRAVRKLARYLGRSPETVNVKYRGVVNLETFACETITHSSLVKRVCYDRREQYMIINLQGTYYHYREIDARTVSALHNASSMGRYFNENIKGRFDCRTRRVPSYK